ncbi:diacylglycerol/lipid kinase family protein [Eubacteriales bacterium KG127]
MSKKAYIIVNPAAGKSQADRFFLQIIQNIQTGGYECTVRATEKSGDAIEFARQAATAYEYDIIVAIGGDGTYNEVVAGVKKSDIDIPVGYIPAGSTNDFADTLGLSNYMPLAALDVTRGVPVKVDIGDFNGRYFSYIASFGAFTGVSYSTPQSMKNVLGHFAYVLSGVAELGNLKPLHIKLETEDRKIEGEYIFGAICNTTSVAGILTLDEELVDLSDGKFEILLIKYPSNPLELNSVLLSLSLRRLKESSMVEFFGGREIKIEADPSMNWTLDGEFQQGESEILIKNIHEGISVLIPSGGDV